MPTTLSRPVTLTDALRSVRGPCRFRCRADGGVYTVERSSTNTVSATFAVCGYPSPVDWDELPGAGWEPA
jgi:hypothetical protein